MSTAVDAAVEAEVHARRWSTLWVLCLSLMIVMIANASLSVALAELARDLDASTSSLQWMVNSYALVFAGLLFSAGTLGDRYGRKGALQAGLVLFLVAAVMATQAGSAPTIIAARAVMGAATAFVMPSTLSISLFTFAVAGVALALFTRREWTTDHPMVDLRCSPTAASAPPRRASPSHSSPYSGCSS